MASGSFYKEFHTSNPKYQLIVEWSSTPTTSTNSSVVKATIKLYCPYGLYIGAREDNTIVINGATYYYDSSAISTSGGNTYTLGTVTSSAISHNSDGSKSIGITCNFQLNATLSSTYYSTITTSQTVTLDNIPRASSISSAGNITLGNACSIKWTPASTSFKYKIKFALGSWSYTTGDISPGTTSAYTYTGYTIPNTADILDDIPNSTTETMTATLYTYSSSNAQIGSASSKTFTVTVPNTVVPTVGTITLTPQTYSSLIQNKNNVKVSVSGFSGGTGSSIKSYTFSGPGLSNTTTTNTSVTSGTISNTGTLTYKVTVTDNRGRTNSATKTISCYAWSAPSIIFDAYRVASSDSTVEDDSGTYIRCVYTIKYSYVNGTNSRKSFTISGGSGVSNITYNSWSKTQTTGVNGIVTETGSAVIKNCPITNTYNIYATITDNYNGNSNSTQITVFSAERILNIRSNGNGIAFGKMADKNNVLDSKWPIRTDDTPQTMKNLTYKGSNLLSPTDDTMENWANMGNLATVYYNQTEKLNGQPAQYGYLLNLTAGPGSTQVHHIWAEQANGNLFHRGGNTNGLYDWKEIFDTSNYTDYVSSKPTVLYSTSTGNIGTITLTQSAADFTYLEIFYTDNNGRQPNSVKIYSPNGKYVSLSCIEPSTSGSDPRVYIRVSGWTISGTSMTVGRSDLSGANRGVYGQMYPHANGTNIDVKVTENNYIKIFRVLGYK